MTLTAVLASLQLAATLLIGLHNNPTASIAIQQQAVTLANHAVQQAVQLQVTPGIPFPTPKINGIWTNVADLQNAAYIGPDGGYVQLGNNVGLLDGDTSFGDINNDGFDDAAAILQRTNAAGQTNIMLAVMLNQNGSLFNIADAQLGDGVQILSHHIIQGGDIVLNIQTPDGATETSTYALVGEQLLKL